MSNYPGFYYYQKPVSCSACIDIAESFGEAVNCGRCKEINRTKVRLLQLSGRIFRHDAVIQHLDSGKLETVPISRLTFGGNDEW